MCPCAKSRGIKCSGSWDNIDLKRGSYDPVLFGCDGRVGYTYKFTFARYSNSCIVSAQQAFTHVAERFQDEAWSEERLKREGKKCCAKWGVSLFDSDGLTQQRDRARAAASIGHGGYR